MVCLADLPLEALIAPSGYACACGRRHVVAMDFLQIGSGAIRAIPQALAAMGCRRPFIVCDKHTKAAAWQFVKPVLGAAGIDYTLYCFPWEHIEPDECAMGALTLAYPPDCDCVMGVGSGVINDCCKVLGHAVGRKQMIVGTAPSMDGFASNSSAMLCRRIKTTLFNACPAAILCDTDIMKNAPMRMLWAGLGDMLAKYSALCEWRISHLVTGEYYCENVAGLMRTSLEKIVGNAAGLRERDPQAVEATVEGLVLSGIAMSYAGISRPASGQEHYFSHMWEMMALDRGEESDLHGIQVGVGTLLTFALYEKLRGLTPQRETAERFMENFSDEEWQKQMRAVFGKAAEPLIEQEHTCWHKNDKSRHGQRLKKLFENWGAIQRAILEEIPDRQRICRLMQGLGMPTTPADIGISDEAVRNALIGSRDSRDKYLLSSMLWDLGILYTDLPLLPN